MSIDLVMQSINNLRKSMGRWIEINGEEICTCKQCRWCTDAVIEAAERIVERRLSIPEALISYRWYEQEGVYKYNEWKEKGLA